MSFEAHCRDKTHFSNLDDLSAQISHVSIGDAGDRRLRSPSVSRNARNAKMPYLVERHDVLRECARLVGEDVLHLLVSCFVCYV